MKRFLVAASILALTSLDAPGQMLAGTVAQLFSVKVIPPSGMTIAAISLTNGPPNLSNGLLAAGLPSGSPVSDLYADMNPMSATFSGSWAVVGGSDASSFATSGNHLVTNGSLSAGTYNIIVGTNGGGVPQVTQPVTINVIDGVHVGCGNQNTIQNAMNANGNNTTFVLAGTYQSPCTYSFSNCTFCVQPKSGSTIIGGGQSATIIDGASGTAHRFFETADTAIDVTFANFTAQNNTFPPTDGIGFQIPNGNIMRNLLLSNIAGFGVYYHGAGIQIINNVFNSNGGYVNLYGVTGQIGDSRTTDIKIIGNEMYGQNKTNLWNSCLDAANNKQLADSGAPAINIQVLNNYIHDNHGGAVWFDTIPAGNKTVRGNTIINNGGTGIHNEVSNNLEADHNVLQDNGGGPEPSNCSNPGPSMAGFGDTNDGPAVQASNVSLQNSNIHDNNMRQSTGLAGWAGGGLQYLDDGRGGSGANVQFQNNQMTFKTTDTSNGFASRWGQTSVGSNSFSNNNTYWMSNNTGEGHFYWNNSGVVSFAGFRSLGQEAGGSVHLGDEVLNDNVTGCRHVACTGAGLGANGLPTVP